MGKISRHFKKKPNSTKFPTKKLGKFSKRSPIKKVSAKALGGFTVRGKCRACGNPRGTNPMCPTCSM